MEPDDEPHGRRLATPSCNASRNHDGSPNRRSRSPRRSEVLRDSIRSHARYRSRSPDRRSVRSTSVRQRERELEREWEKIRRLEDELCRARMRSVSTTRSYREPNNSACRIDTASVPQTAHPNSDNPIPESANNRFRKRRFSQTEMEDRGPGPQSAKRSSSPSFSAKDVIDIINSIKTSSTSQPSTEAQHSNKFNYKNIVPEFDPSSKNQRIDIWLRKVNECATVYGWDDKTIVHFAMQKLQGLAKTWYEGLNSILFSWPEWQEKLLLAFPFEQNFGQCLEDMLKRKSRVNEPIEVYFYEKMALVNQCDIIGKRAVDCVIHGLSDKTLKTSALALRCTEPDQLLQFLMSNKDMAPTVSPNDRSNFYRGKFSNGTRPSGNTNNTDNDRHINATNKPALFCFNCKQAGHPYMKCPKPLLKCQNCFRFGHKADSCYQKTQSGSNNKTEVPKKTMCIIASKINSKYVKPAIINNVKLQAFVDFGSDVSLLAESVLPTLGLDSEKVQVPLKGFGNEIVQAIGSIHTNLEIDGVKADVKFYVVKDKYLEFPVLVGQSYTEQPHVVVFKNAEYLRFLDVCTEFPFSDTNLDDDQNVMMRLVSDIELHGPGSVAVSIDPPINGDVIISTKVVGKPQNQYMIYGGVYKVAGGFTKISVAPVSSRLQLLMGTMLCRATRIKVVNRIISSSSEISSPGDREIGGKDVCVGEDTDELYINKLNDVLNRYKHCFASSLQELGCTNTTEMTIEVQSKQPIVYRPYRLSHKEREQVREMVKEMLDAGIIQESVSEYASPIILVRKKDGKLRMCIDYRLLNAVTVKERYPMPVIEDEIARLSGQAYFITLDLASGYYQVPIADSSKPLTAFVTPDGQYQFNRMPFGLANAPAVFQRMMHKVLGSARYTEATAYIDDILIYGRDEKECLNRLEHVLQLLESANLTLNLSKCKFLTKKVDYLGYEISAEGIRPGDKKINCVNDFPRPSNQHTVRQFLGLVGYFRKFIRNFAHIAHPLNKLLKKDEPWCWSDEQEDAFKDLKHRLVNRPILTIYDPEAETELHTDASKIGIGGILLQRPASGGEFRPVAFYSRQTTPEEKHFHAYELETLAVICSLKKFRVYLLGQNFKIVTDCSALRSTFLKRDIIPRVARWWLLLQEFQCSIEYRAGTKMGHVDALSRNPVPDSETSDALGQYPSVMSITSEDWLQTLQLGDPELCRVKDILVSAIDTDGLKYIKDNYRIKDGRLYKIIEGDENNLRWVVPKGARWQLCRLNHDEIGHFGSEKTLERIKKTYWFPKMNRFVKKYVNACMQCAYAKDTSHRKEGYLHTIEKIEIPFHTVHIDHLGPFVKSKRGNTHLLVMVEAFTKFVFIKAVRNTNTQNVIRALEDVFFTFRFPDRIVSDRGSCFTSHAFKRFCLDKGVKHVLNAVACPRSNGQVERYNRSILDALKAQNLNDNEKVWDEKIGAVQWGMNNTKQKTTGKTPAEVLFGTSMNSELDPKFNEIRLEISENDDIMAIRQEVKKNIQEQQSKQKQYYDKNRKPARTYNEGELVKITKVAFNNEGKSTKLMPSYIGPYRVVKVLGNDRYELASVPGLTGSKNKRCTTVASDRMSPWVHIAALELHSDDDRNCNYSASDND